MVTCVIEATENTERNQHQPPEGSWWRWWWKRWLHKSHAHSKSLFHFDGMESAFPANWSFYLLDFILNTPPDAHIIFSHSTSKHIYIYISINLSVYTYILLCVFFHWYSQIGWCCVIELVFSVWSISFYRFFCVRRCCFYSNATIWMQMEIEFMVFGEWQCLRAHACVCVCVQTIYRLLMHMH